jgi:hypothetical protein
MPNPRILGDIQKKVKIKIPPLCPMTLHLHARMSSAVLQHILSPTQIMTVKFSWHRINDHSWHSATFIVCQDKPDLHSTFLLDVQMPTSCWHHTPLVIWAEITFKGCSILCVTPKCCPKCKSVCKSLHSIQ